MPLSRELIQKIDNIYTTPGSPALFSGASRLYQECQRQNISVTWKQIKEYLRTQNVHSLHLISPEKHIRSRLISYSIDYSWESNLAVAPYPTSNKNVKFIMVVTDLLSDYIWAYPMQRKTAGAATTAFNQLMVDTGRKCSLLTTDSGTEYTNNTFQNLLKQNDIYHHLAGGKLKASAAEYSIRLMKSAIFKYLTQNGGKKYIDQLPNLISGLNSRRMKSLNGLAPDQITIANQNAVFMYKYSAALQKQVEVKYRIGQLVRIRLKKVGAFDKGYTQNFSAETFKIKKISLAVPTVVYTVVDLNGRVMDKRFYKEDLSPVHV